MGKEYIEREAALNAAYKIGKKEYDRGRVSNTATVMVVEDYLRAIPAADVRPVVRARWNTVKYPLYECSNCGAVYQEVGYGFNYCPNCGADMRET